MALRNTELEPVTPDPRKLRLTAMILVAIMVLGGGLILNAYQRYNVGQSKNDRPAMATNRLTGEKDLPLLRQDGSQAGLFGLAGKITVIHTLSAAAPISSARTNEIMRRLSERYSGQADCVLVSLVLDPGPPKDATAILATAATALGAKLPSWWVATTEPKILQKYVKKELKASTFPHFKDGRWIHDTSIVVVDRNRIIRQPVVHQRRGGQPWVGPFDFDQAASWDERGVKSGTTRSNAEELEALLIRTIDELLAEPVKTS